MATIKEVAAQAGVSVATVSRVLNNNGYVSEDAKKQVLKIVELMNYKPNEVARTLYKKQSNTVALIVPDITNPFFPELARAIEDTLNIYGYTLMLCNSDEKPEKEQGYMDMLKQRYVDGAILVSNILTAKDIKNLDLPVVIIDRSIHDNISTVVSKNFEGAKQATLFLKETGCHIVAHIQGPEHVITANERYQGYLDVVKDTDWFDENLVVKGNYDMKTSAQVTKKLLNEHPEIDGIFAGNDLMAVGVIKAVKQMGKRIPEDISIVGFDGITLGEMISPELTTIKQPIYDMGMIGARMLIKQIEKKPSEQSLHEFPVKLIKRETTR